MKVKSIGVSKGRTINMGDYNSVRYDFWMEAEGIGEGKVADAVKKQIEKYVDGWDNEEFDFWMEQKRDAKGEVWK